jgi:hypothetical protein
MSRTMLLLAAASVVAVCAGAQAQGLTGPHAADARRACATMGLNTSEAPFIYCVISLNESAAQMDQAALTQGDRNACFARGMKSGTPAFANCVLDREDTVYRDDNPLLH